MNIAYYRNRRVFLTGHTGFKGSWLSLLLLKLGAEVHGFALPPPTSPALFEQLKLKQRVHHTEGDVRDLSHLQSTLNDVGPDIVFHLAAQSLVRSSYAQPASTFATNAMGTVHVLEALRNLGRPCTVVIVTSDKCYENHESLYGYREIDALGGADPYSGSKAMAELAVASYRASFFRDRLVRVASARAGNVIGGGDWATDRIVPDCVRALRVGEPIAVRNPSSRRPWQHVLDPLHGYLHLAATLASADGPQYERLAAAFNFGPSDDADRTVGELVDEFLTTYPGSWQANPETDGPHETRSLHLATDKARTILRWRSHWDFQTSVRATARWYRAVSQGESPEHLTEAQIEQYLNTRNDPSQR